VEHYFIVYTGNGKGKTPAAAGLALRSSGWGIRVAFIQFIKGPRDSGEITQLGRINSVDVIRLGKGMIRRSADKEAEMETARKAWDKAKGILLSGEYGMVILDEFTYLCSYGIVDAGDALDVIRRSREISDVVVTGRNAPASLMDAADMVTEMRNIRHPLQRGIPSREGIEY